MTGCSVEGCDRAFYGKGYCKLHYDRVFRMKRDVGPAEVLKIAKLDKVCQKCEKKVHSKNLCNFHYRRELSLKEDNPCEILLCNRRILARGFCRNHYDSFIKGPKRRKLYANAKGFATANQINQRLIYFNFKCWICGCKYEEIDHVKPLVKGGSKWPSNLRPICKSCNSKKKDRWPI